MIGLHTLTTTLIAIASIAAAMRVLRFATRWRWPLALGQLIAGALLYVVLFPPIAAEGGGQLDVLTPGVTAQQMASVSTANSIAMPGISGAVDSRIERSPDLASALRRHPQTTRLRVFGHGLPARDRDAARGLSVAFEPAPLPDGIVELALPSSVQVGNRFRIAGRLQSSNVDGVMVELRDPADAVTASTKTDGQGRFTLDGVARVAGVARFAVRAMDATGQSLDRIPILVDARSDDVIRILLLAAVPSPELKYLRRWASDSGLIVDSRIGLSDGIALGSGDNATIDAALLAKQDLLVIDERRWLQLDGATRSAIVTAVDGGLGLLLRVTGPLSPELLAAWSTLGVDLQAADNTQPAALADDARDDAPLLTRVPYRLAPTFAPMVTTRAGDTMVGWQPRGRGRIGITTLIDSYREVLAGSADRHGSLWSRITGTLSRARADAQPQLPMLARVGERASVCGLIGEGWSITASDAEPTSLLVDRDNDDCAAFWPSESGEHRLLHRGTTWSLNVLAADAGAALEASQSQQASIAIAADQTAGVDAITTKKLPRSVWLLAWLLVMGALWWVERRAWLVGSSGRS